MKDISYIAAFPKSGITYLNFMLFHVLFDRPQDVRLIDSDYIFDVHESLARVPQPGVVNRYVKKGNDIEPQEIERSLGIKVSWLIPNDFKNAMSAINFGEPVVLRVPRSEMSVSLVQLAGLVSNKQNATTVAA